MAALLTVPQLSSAHNPDDPSALVPRRGVLTLFGYGIKVKLDRGHLVIEDGIGPHRRTARLPRIGHGLRRLVVIGSDGREGSFSARRTRVHFRLLPTPEFRVALDPDNVNAS
jgi:hypothetical protein